MPVAWVAIGIGIVALYPVSTVALAATVLKERMTKPQFVAVGLVAIASLLFSATPGYAATGRSPAHARLR
jgi:EamA domain-containing membrane protein RarD